MLQTEGNGPQTVQELDEEMEKVFAMDAGEKFDVALLGSRSDSVGVNVASDRDRDRERPAAFPRYGDRGLERKYTQSTKKG